MEVIRTDNKTKQNSNDLAKNTFSSNLNQIKENKLSELGDDRAPEATNPQYIQRMIPEKQKSNDCVLVAVEIISNGEITRERLAERLSQQDNTNIETQGTTTNAMLKAAREFGLIEEFVSLDEKTIREHLSADQPLYVVYKSESGVGKFSPYSSAIEEKTLSKTIKENPASNQENIKGHAAVIVGIESFNNNSPVVIMMDGFGITRMNLETLQELHRAAAKHDTSAPWSDSETPMAMVLKRKE